MINYNNLLFKTGNTVTNNFDFLRQFGTLYDLSIDLLTEKISIFKAANKQNGMFKKIEQLKDFTLLEEKSITKKKHHTKVL